MQPLLLTLKGFRGIRDGLGLDEITLNLKRLPTGAELIAIAGANGAGKTTLMDCLTPYLTLPSRAAAVGGFSFYDHVCLPLSEKDLTWRHEGRTYRSRAVIRLGGRRRIEAFLHVRSEAGQWVPVALDDGTRSDGRVETYTRCVEGICGSEDTFFTSVFCAQGRRQLSTYRNAEIKALLADLLGQEEIRAWGQKAAETARLLKAGLIAVRQEEAALTGESQRIETARQQLAGVSNRLGLAERAKQAAQSEVEAAQARHVRLVAAQEQSQATQTRRAQLTAERQAIYDNAATAARTLKSQDQGEGQRLMRLDQRVADRLHQQRARHQVLMQSRKRCFDVLAESAAVQRATRRLQLAERVRDVRVTRTQAGRKQVEALAQGQGAARLIQQKMAGIEREAGKAMLKAEELAHRFGLTGEVPCAGTDLQGACKLLGDAREAQALIPSAKAQITQLSRERRQAQQELDAAHQQGQTLQGAPQALAWAEHREGVARERVSRMAVLASKMDACEQANTALAEIELELTALGNETSAAETVDERTERRQIDTSRRAISAQLAQQAKQTAAAVARVDNALAALPAEFDARQLMRAAEDLKTARAALATAEQSMMAAVRDQQTLEELSKQAAGLVEHQQQIGARIAHVETELGSWNLFARCMSNDGLIALAIDDAGPALASLSNDLLLACYGRRFTVSIHTLRENGKGDQKEGFDIIVHDGMTGESKSVGMMSGGERTWVEACLTRAIALYLARHTGRRYTTLFSDEADGALDPERKRMFMAMKREVRRLGGYEREFFVSQTPELTAMADAVIDLDALKASGDASGCVTAVVPSGISLQAV
jgi:exonuclease SbcC